MEPQQISPESAKKIAQQIVTEGVQGFSPVGGLEQKAIEAVQAGRGEEALKMTAGEVIPYTEADVEGVLREHLSSEPRGVDGRKGEPRSNTPERQRYEEAKKTALACLQYLKEGQGEPPQELTRAVVDYLAQNPAFGEVIFDINQTPPRLRKNEAETIANNLLRQPEVRRNLYAFFVERLNPTKRLPHELTVTQLKQELFALSTQVILKSETDILNEISKTNKEIQRKRRDIESDPEYNNYFNEKLNLDRIEKAIKAIQEGKLLPNSAEWNNMLAQFSAIIQPATNTDAQSVLNDLIKGKLKVEQTLSDKRFDKIRKREEEIIAFNGKLEELEKERQRVNSEENKKLLIEYQAKEQQLKEAQVLLTAEIIKYASEVTAIPKEAVKKYLEEALGRAGAVYKQQAVEEAQKKEKEGQENLLRAVEKIVERLGRKSVNRKGEIRFLPDKKEARKLLVLLMQPVGVERFMQTVANNESTLRRYGLTDDESKAILVKMGDPEFVRNTGIHLAKKLLADYLLTGGRLSQDDIIAMGNADWVMSLINDGAKIAQDKREQIESLLGKDVLTKFDEIKQGKSTGEWLKANWWKFGLGILVILLLLGLGGQKLLTA